MKYKDLEKLSAADLDKKLKETRVELIKLNGQVETGTTPKSPGQIKNLKKTIAKINTLQNKGKQ
ncbi:MAG: 50S ribosomal protein L29 [Nanoarchaeota archaeon]|nr:50S ribosomal protein L29 [Nanoarchaeota archaeon]